MFDFPEEAASNGFVVEGLGAHSSRTMMLAELRLLLAACLPDATVDAYREAILAENVLLKQTQATRKESLRRLRELYGLDRQLLIFRVLRELWAAAEAEAQPLLGLLAALARDPLLRATAGLILATPTGEAVEAHMISAAAGLAYPGLNAMTLANLGRHAASTWTQSGHLRGRTHKVRVAAQAQQVSTAYALLLGYLCGGRGEGLFSTPWARLLDAPAHTLHHLAAEAARYGWLDYRHSGAVTDISFHYFLAEKELDQR